MILSVLLSVCTLIGCGDQASLGKTEKPSSGAGGEEEVPLEPTDPVNGFLIIIQVPNECCKVSQKVVEVKRGETPISLPTPECEYDEHTFKYWKYNDEKLLRVSDIWSRIDETAKSATVKAYCKRNWTNNH